MVGRLAGPSHRWKSFLPRARASHRWRRDWARRRPPATSGFGKRVRFCQDRSVRPTIDSPPDGPRDADPAGNMSRPRRYFSPSMPPNAFAKAGGAL